jgi:plasmid stabilization system protein ParE
MTLELSKRARSDIKNITRYTLESFGLAKADEYLDGLYKLFDLLTDNPKFGREWAGGGRRCVYRMHYLYYRLVGTRIFITHVRHSSRNPL